MNSSLTSLHRRDFLSHAALGLGGVALASLLSRDQLLAAAPAAVPGTHHEPKARRVIHIFLEGGLSQVDSFDYKPELIRQHNRPLPASIQPDVFFRQVGQLHRPHFEFRQRGRSGLWMSNLFPRLAEQADQLTFIHSMVSETGNHTPATYQALTGFRVLGFPAAGAWISYGLGNLSDNLPTFVVLPDARGLPTGVANNWSSGFLPARHQGVVFHTRGTPINDLQSAQPVREETRQARLQMLERMNRRHLTQHGNEDALATRIRSYELAGRMQAAVPEAADLNRESQQTREMYGIERSECADFARSCLLARRLLERGVRFVQLWSGGPFGGPTWDAHDNVPGNHGGEARRIDQPVAALLRDLRERGMLEDTLVFFTTEFGRTPFAQTGAGRLGTGRDHNQTAFSIWLAGAGLRPGMSYGATDEFGYRSVENPVTIYDLYATILYLLGIDHERLTYYHNGIARRLTNVHGSVIRPILA